jgi:hypothetical protein
MKYDPTTGELIDIYVEDTPEPSQQPIHYSFKPVCLLHSTAQMTGRTMRVWLVKEGDRFYVLKDYWILSSHPFSEISTLKKINDVMKGNPEARKSLRHCYPIFIAGQTLGDSTDLRRIEVPIKPPAREHHRIVTGPVGDPLTSFCSKKEFCSVIRDIVKCELCFFLLVKFHLIISQDLHFLNVECGIIHGDISLNNLCINRVWNANSGDSEFEDDDDDSELSQSHGIKTSSTGLHHAVHTADTPPAHDTPRIAQSSLQGITLTPQDPVAFGLAIDNDNDYSISKHQTNELHITTIRSAKHPNVTLSDTFVLGYCPLHVPRCALDTTRQVHSFRSRP